MEPVTKRIALHFNTTELDACLAFYHDLVGFSVAKDIVLVGGERWIAVTHPDNLGIQLHFHPPSEHENHAAMKLEFSHPDPHSLVPKFRNAGIELEKYECKSNWEILFDDPLGNRVCLSFWGED